MKNRTQVALAVGAGYVLGRRHRRRLAAIVGVAAATGGFGGLTGQLLRRGSKLIGDSGALGKLSPELGEVADMVRGDLLDAGKAAALTAARSRVNRVSDMLRDRADMLRQSSAEDAEAEPEETSAGETDGSHDEADESAADAYEHEESAADAYEDEDVGDAQDGGEYDEDAEDVSDAAEDSDEEDVSDAAEDSDAEEARADATDGDDEVDEPEPAEPGPGEDRYEEPGDDEEDSPGNQERLASAAVRQGNRRRRSSTRAPVQRTRRR